jgi:hypothetical protein
MTRFDSLVQEALRERSDLAPLRPVVEKELLHPGVLRRQDPGPGPPGSPHEMARRVG